MDKQCSSCGGFCKKSGCERENVQPQRTWRWLTDEEIYLAWDTIIEDPKQAIQFAYNIQAKLKEKNT